MSPYDVDNTIRITDFVSPIISDLPNPSFSTGNRVGIVLEVPKGLLKRLSIGPWNTSY